MHFREKKDKDDLAGYSDEESMTGMSTVASRRSRGTIGGVVDYSSNIPHLTVEPQSAR